MSDAKLRATLPRPFSPPNILITPDYSTVFGLGSSLNTRAACVALIGIIIFTVIFEVSAHRLDHALVGTPYKEMVEKIYRELTILGLIR